LQNEVPPRQRKVSGQAGPLGACGLLHHLNQHLLARLQQFRDPCRPFLETQRTEIRHVNKTVLLALADVHESGVDARQNVLHRAEVHIADLIAPLRHDQFINAVIGQNCRDAQLLGDDDLLGHKQELTQPVRTNAESTDRLGRRTEEIEIASGKDPQVAMARSETLLWSICFSAVTPAGTKAQASRSKQ